MHMNLQNMKGIEGMDNFDAMINIHLQKMMGVE